VDGSPHVSQRLYSSGELFCDISCDYSLRYALRYSPQAISDAAFRPRYALVAPVLGQSAKSPIGTGQDHADRVDYPFFIIISA